MPPDEQVRNGLRELRAGIEVGVGDAAVPGPEAGVDGELREVGEPSAVAAEALVRAGRLAARQMPERLQVGRLRALRFQVLAEERGVADLVVGVVVNVLR